MLALHPLTPLLLQSKTPKIHLQPDETTPKTHLPYKRKNTFIKLQAISGWNGGQACIPAGNGGQGWGPGPLVSRLRKGPGLHPKSGLIPRGWRQNPELTVKTRPTPPPGFQCRIPQVPPSPAGRKGNPLPSPPAACAPSPHFLPFFGSMIWDFWGFVLASMCLGKCVLGVCCGMCFGGVFWGVLGCVLGLHTCGDPTICPGTKGRQRACQGRETVTQTRQGWIMWIKSGSSRG